MLPIPGFSYDCPKTWNLIKSGQTKGGFQCESHLVANYLRKVAPSNIWELSAVIALVRPGALKSGFAEDYIDYKNNGKEHVSFGHPIIDSVFESTHHVLVYQETLMNLGTRLAYSDLPPLECKVKVDELRKGVGKKDQAKLLLIGKEFMAGCIKNGVEPSIAEKLFEIIKNCGRYLFNLSHSIQYAHLAYETLWLKANFPLQFVASYLTYAQFKQGQRKPGEEIVGKFKEIRDFVIESQKVGLEILPPNFNKRNENFAIEGEAIRYGLAHIKGFGTKTFDEVKDFPIIDNWKKFFIMASSDLYGANINSRVIKSLISSGSLQETGESRMTLKNMFKIVDKLTEKEISYCLEHLEECQDVKDFPVLLNKCSLEGCTKRRSETVRSLAALFEIVPDHPAAIELEESALLGIHLTASSVDHKVSDADSRCEDCRTDHQEGAIRHVNVVIAKIISTTTKKGKNPGQKMARINVHDGTGSLDNIPVFPDLYLECEHILMEHNTVKIVLQFKNNSWIAMSLEQI